MTCCSSPSEWKAEQGVMPGFSLLPEPALHMWSQDLWQAFLNLWAVTASPWRGLRTGANMSPEKMQHNFTAGNREYPQPYLCLLQHQKNSRELLEGLVHPRLQSWCFLGCSALSSVNTCWLYNQLHVRVAKEPGCEQKQALPHWVSCIAPVAQEHNKDFWKGFVMLLHPHGNLSGAIPRQTAFPYSPLCAPGSLPRSELPRICDRGILHLSD